MVSLAVKSLRPHVFVLWSFVYWHAFLSLDVGQFGGEKDSVVVDYLQKICVKEQMAMVAIDAWAQGGVVFFALDFWMVKKVLRRLGRFERLYNSIYARELPTADFSFLISPPYVRMG